MGGSLPRDKSQRESDNKPNTYLTHPFIKNNVFMFHDASVSFHLYIGMFSLYAKGVTATREETPSTEW